MANNASWCDTVCRSHGYPGTFGTALWSSPRHRLQFYPHAITLLPEVTAPEVLAAAEPSRPFAVKDSFARLDLAPVGFELLGEADWIAREVEATGWPYDGPRWEVVARPANLDGWEAAWSDGSGSGPVFLPILLSDPRCAILACRQENTIIAGAIAYTADGVTGISNVFSAGLPIDLVWPGVWHAVSRLHPHLPVVGYEEGPILKAAQKAGFRTLGALRIYTRNEN